MDILWFVESSIHWRTSAFFQLLLQIKLIWTFIYRFLCEHKCLFLWNKLPRVQFLDCMVIAYLCAFFLICRSFLYILGINPFFTCMWLHKRLQNLLPFCKLTFYCVDEWKPLILISPKLAIFHSQCFLYKKSFSTHRSKRYSPIFFTNFY